MAVLICMPLPFHLLVLLRLLGERPFRGLSVLFGVKMIELEAI
jgi:hypothetical protein